MIIELLLSISSGIISGLIVYFITNSKNILDNTSPPVYILVTYTDVQPKSANKPVVISNNTDNSIGGLLIIGIIFITYVLAKWLHNYHHEFVLYGWLIVSLVATICLISVIISYLNTKNIDGYSIWIIFTTIATIIIWYIYVKYLLSPATLAFLKTISYLSISDAVPHIIRENAARDLLLKSFVGLFFLVWSLSFQLRQGIFCYLPP